MSAVMNTTLLDKEELAEHLKCSIRQIERLLHEGLPFIPTGSRAKLYRLESVNHWLLSRESCLSEKTKKAVGTSTSAWIEDEYTAAYERAQQKRRRKTSKPNSAPHLRLAK